MELVQTFNKTLNDFVLNLKKFYPVEMKDVSSIDNLDDTLPLQKFMISLGTNFSKISNKDETLFSEPFIPIENCNLSEIWTIEEKKANHEAIWKFLQTLFLLGNTIKSKSVNLEEFFEQFENMDNIGENDISKQMFNIFESLVGEQNEFDISEDDITGEDTTGKNNETENKETEPEPKNEEEYTKMFEGTKIGSLAEEISKDIDMSEFEDLNMESPDIKSVMEKLVGGGGLTKLIKNVAGKLKNKFDSGDVRQEDLMQEVTQMMEKMKGDKKFKKMFKGKNMENIFKDFMKAQGGAGGFPGMPDGIPGMGGENGEDDFSSLEEMFSNQMNNIPKNAKINSNALKANTKKMSTRDRLLKKLEAKKNNA